LKDITHMEKYISKIKAKQSFQSPGQTIRVAAV
jgi:hypothetical protein